MEDKDNMPGEADNNDRKNWYLWGIYYNPDDKRIFPPKRIKYLGWTVNFANAYSIGAFVLLIAGLILVKRLFK